MDSYPDSKNTSFFTKLGRVLAGKAIDRNGVKAELAKIAFYNFPPISLIVLELGIGSH